VIRFLVAVMLVVALAYCGATVKLGKRTFFGHVKAIWSTEEAQDMREGVSEKAKPVVDKVKRGVEAGVRAASEEEGGSGSGSGSPEPAPAGGR